MDKIRIHGPCLLQGRVRASGAKNAVLPEMAATLLVDGPVTLRNVPVVRDVQTMIKVLRHLGARRVSLDGDVLRVEGGAAGEPEAPYDLVRTMRASILVLGPLLARLGRARVSLPGGCAIGARPIDYHIEALRRMGAAIEIEHGFVVASSPRLKGAEIVFAERTVTGTENVMMAAVLAPGTTIIECAACEPEVQEVAKLLVKMGAVIDGIGSPRLTITGVKKLHGCTFDIMPDRIEAGTFMAAAALTGGDVSIEKCNPDHLMCVIECMRQAGVIIETGPDWIRVRGNGMFHPVNVATLPYPGFPTDMQAQFMAMMARGEGISIVTERIYPERFHHVREFGRMGANIVREGPSAIVIGVKELSGAPVMASDLRAAAGLLVAALAARGETVLQRIYHLDRGYDQIEKRLESLGARIRRSDLKPEAAPLREAV